MANPEDDARFLSSLLEAVSRPNRSDYIERRGSDSDSDPENIQDVFNPRRPDRNTRTGPAFNKVLSQSSSATAAAAADFRSLTRYFVAEKSVSTLLPWPASLVGRVMGRLERQIAKIERIQADIEAGIEEGKAANADAGGGGGGGPGNSSLLSQRFVLVALETDLERYKFLIRALLRTRLSKISEFGRVWLRHDERVLAEAGIADSQGRDRDNPDQTPSSSASAFNRQSSTFASSLPARQPSTAFPLSPSASRPQSSPLSAALPLLLGPEEKSFALAHTALFEQHVLASCLDRFPPSFRRLDDNSAGIDMLQGPDEDECVIVRVLEGNETDSSKNSGGQGRTSGLDGDDDYRDSHARDDGPEEWRQGDIWVLQWRQVKREWERGRVELL